MFRCFAFAFIVCFSCSLLAQPVKTPLPPAKVLPKPGPSSAEPVDISYQKRIKLDRINRVYIPKDLADAHAQLDVMVEAKIKATYARMPEDEAWRSQMWGVGKWMMLKWSFYEGSRLSVHLKQLGVFHPEDQAAFLLITWYRHLNVQELKTEELAKAFKEKRYKALQEELKDEKVIKEIKLPTDSTRITSPRQR